jgi:hypothetical protein
VSGLEDDVAKWWERLNDDQRSRVKQAAEKSDTDADGAKVLIDTRCPVGPIGTRWDNNPEYSWTWPESVRQFVLDQQ